MKRVNKHKAHAQIAMVRKAMCDGKRRYEYECDAEQALSRLSMKHKDCGLRLYDCVFCNGYHVGRQPSNKAMRSITRLLTLRNLIDFDFELAREQEQEQ